jgi:site-specific DNA recombinase
MDKPRAKNVGIWIRVSTEDQAKGESPEHHERRARYYAESKDWKVKEVYHLEAVSGKSVKDHPETQRMVKDIKSGHITGLIFSKLARLARNTRELLDFADTFREHNADLISLQEAIDTSTPAGRLFYTMIAAMAQWEREEIAERIAASVPIRAKLGKSLGGAAPFGYRKDGASKRLVPDPNEASVRKHIYELFLEHKRVRTVANLLNEKGHRTRNGSKFTHTTVERLLRDPTAKGMRRANYTRSSGDKKSWEIKPEKDWVWSEVEPIVSEELWNQCNQILEERDKNGKRTAKKPVHLFTGLTYCADGNKMYVPSNSPKYICYKCRNKIPVEELETAFQEQLKNFLLSPTEMTAYLHDADETIKAKEELRKTLEKERQKLKSETDKLMRLYYDDKISADGFAAQNRPLEERAKQVNEQLPQLQAELDYLKVNFVSSDEVLSEASDLYGHWTTLDAEGKRKIVENITDRITIGKEEINIKLCYLPSSPKMMVDRSRNLKDSSPRPA